MSERQDHAALDPWRDPPLECDIVMKGGLSSGVVYPEAVVRLAERYRFRGIGGTSAGAIAAVGLAAAEHGRADGGMAKLAAIPARLTETVDGQPFILSLFRPEPETRRLFESALAFQRGRPRGVATLLARFWRFPAAALALAVVAAVLGVTGAVDAAVAVLAPRPRAVDPRPRRALGRLAGRRRRRRQRLRPVQARAGERPAGRA